MRARDYFILGWDQLRRRKVVTALCAAGIAIGSASIIVALAFGESVTHYSQERMSHYLKTDEISVYPGVPPGGDDSRKDESGLTRQKMELIRSIPHVAAVASYRELGEFEFTVDDTKQGYVRLIATEPENMAAFGITFQQGTASDLDNAVAVEYGVTMNLRDEQTERLRSSMSQAVPDREQNEEWRRLRYLSYPLYRKTLALGHSGNGAAGAAELNLPLRVSGILEKPVGLPDEMVLNQKTGYVTPALGERLARLTAGANGGGGNPPNGPPKTEIDRLTVKVDSPQHVPQVEEIIRKLNVNTSSNLHQQERMNEEFVIVRIVFGGIGLFVLFVASISIVVAMTMSTHQRRRQIGIMKVLGASLGQIRNMFIVESALLGLLGGVLGILLSYWVIWAINIVLIRFTGGSGDTEQLLFISLWILPVGLFFALLTGVLSGLYPAVKASRTDALTAIKRD